MEVKDQDRYKAFSRRTALMSAGGFGILSTLFGRLYYLQVIKSAEYADMADDNRMSMELLAPVRGRIFDRFGVELAANTKNFRVVLIPEQTESVEASLDELAKVLPISAGQRKKVLRAAARQRKFSTIVVTDNLSWDDFARVNINGPSLAGIKPDAGVSRYYPFGPELAHVVGYVAAVNEEEINDDPVLALPGFRIGKSGIERQIETELRGTAGSRQVEVNAYGKVKRELSRTEGVPGKDAVLTLDMDLQAVAMKRLAGESAAAVVMDIKTGDVLALASAPAFDPNDFVVGIGQKEWKALNADKYNPLLNKSIAGAYSPGSTFKLITALAALESGVMTPEDRVFCRGSIHFGNRTWYGWKKTGHGALNMRGAIKHSCDIFFYEAARRTGIDNIEKMAKRFGLGKAFDFGMPGEKSGLVPGKGWKIANRGVRWQTGDTLNVGIGQGDLLTTPVQLATMTARVANGGFAVTPRIFRSIGSAPSPPEDAVPMGVSRDHLNVVLAGMNGVSNEPGGTAYRSRIWDKGMELAGKTGTVQVYSITKAERLAGIRKGDQLPWKLRDHAWFVAFAPVAAPRYALSVFVEHGISGSRAAAPIARDIMRAVLLKDPARIRAIPPVASGQIIRPALIRES